MKKKKSWVPIKKLQRNDRPTTSFSSTEQQQKNNPQPPSLPPSTMEHQKNKIHPSLPSNYVTLAQLQERWLKQKNEINQQQKDEEEEEEEKQQKRREEKEEEKQVSLTVAVVAPTNGIVSRSHSPAERQQEEKQVPVAVDVVAPTNGTVSRSHATARRHRYRNRNDSSSKHRMEEAAFEYRRKLENGAGVRGNRLKSESGSGIGQNRLKSEIGEQQQEEKQVTVAVAVVAPTNVTVSRSSPAPERHRRYNRSDKRRTDDAASENRQKLENGAGIGEKHGAVIKEKHLKSETGAVIEEKHLKLETGAEIGEKHLKSETGAEIGDENADLNGESKKKKRWKKWKKKWKENMKKLKVEEEKGGIENGTAEHENEVAEKTTIESELNDEKNVQSLTVEKVEEKFGDLSLNPRNGKQNGKFSRMKNGFRESQSQFQSKYRGGGYGRFRNQRRFGDRRRFNSSSPMIWVKKDGGDGEIER